MIYLTAIE